MHERAGFLHKKKWREAQLDFLSNLKINQLPQKGKHLFTALVRSGLIALFLKNTRLRRWVLDKALQRVREYIFTKDFFTEPVQAKEDNFRIVCNLFNSILKGYEAGNISTAYLVKLINALSYTGKTQAAQTANFEKRHGYKPPMWMLLSPTQACNLECTGCYAACDKKNRTTMDFKTVCRILEEKQESWGSYFTVISGGEPFMFRSGGKTLFDVFKRFPNNLFLVYTNGTLITEKVAGQIAEAGNVTVAISVEGYERETDERRGGGTHKKILRAMENLKNAGVWFGLSITLTSKNADLFISGFDKFCEFYFKNRGASYAWLFQYMPVGRDHNTFDLVVSPEKRKALFDVTWKLINEEGYFFADFWNMGVVTGGCMSAGRTGGFVYIDWSGNVMPCVFNHYYMDNIKEVYKKGGHLDDVLFSPLMKGIRNWQSRHFFNTGPLSEKKSILTCCPLKDHFGQTYEVLKSCDIKFNGKDAEAAFYDEPYRKKLIKYGKDSQKLFDPVWEQKYQQLLSGC